MSLFEVDEADQLKIVEANLERKFGDRVPKRRIQAEFDRAVHRFDGARIRSFVPVLVGREVADTLRHTG